MQTTVKVLAKGHRKPFSFCHLLQDVVGLLSGDVNSLSSSHSQPLSHLCILQLSHSWGSSSYQILSVVCCCHSSCFKDFFALITLQQMHLVKKINFVTKRSPTTLDPGVSNTSRRLVKTKQIRNMANIHTSQKRDFKRFKKWFSICHPPQISEGGHGADSQVVEQLAPGFPGFD